MLDAAVKTLGLAGRPNFITRDYASRHGQAFASASWCDMGVTWWARSSDNARAVLPAGDRAYTIWHAQDFQKLKRWRTGTAVNIRRYARPGDIVFFDWGGADVVGAIDHVGVIIRNLGDGRVETIEANTGDAVRRRVRGASVIAGFGQPVYGTDNWTEAAVRELPLLKKGARGEHVQTLQGLLIARSHPEVKVTGVFDDVTEKAVREVQKWGKITVDGEVGQQSWPVLLRVA